jgi:hypothetical protein
LRQAFGQVGRPTKLEVSHMIRDRSQCAPGGIPRRSGLAVLSRLGALVVTVVAVASVDVTAAAAAGQSITAPTTGPAGGVVVIGGSGWPAFDHVNAFLLQGTTSTYFCGLSADSAGTLNPATCALPDLPAGAYTVTSSDGTLTANGPANGFTLTPSVTMANTAGSVITNAAVGDTVDLVGNGFAGLSTITKVTVGTTVVTTTPAAPTTSASGTFSGASFVVPAVTTAGPYTVKVTDAASHSGSAVLTVYKPTLIVPASAPPGSVFSMSGAGWPVGDHLYLYLTQGSTSTYMGCNTYSDSTGALDPQSCTVPSGFTQGAYTLVLSDGAVSVAKPFTLNPGIVLTNSSGTAVVTAAVGDTVTLAGNGFTPSSTITKVTVGTTAVTTTPATPTLSSTGSFTGASFVVPALAPGSYIVTVTDATGKKGTAALTVYKPTLTAPAAGVSGTQFVYSGAGWPVGDHLYLYLTQGTTSTYIGCSTSSDSTGTLVPQTCTVPTGFAQGAYTLVLSDGAVSVSSAFTLNPAISITNTSSQPIASAAPGTTVDLSGSGFTGLSTITKLAFGTTTVPITPASPATSATGSFAGESFTVPNITPGTYTVTGTDAAGKHGSVTFTVT